MGILARLVVLLPLALSIVGIVLSSLALFAGRDRGFMEDYDIVRLNTSKLGQDLIPWDEIDTSSIIDDITDNWRRDIKDDIKDSLNDAKDDAKDSLNDAKDDVNDSIDDAKDKADDVKNDVKDDVNNAKDDAKDKIDEVEEDLKDKGSDLTNEVIDRVTERLGISDWYSLHVMSACQGYYEPNATEHDPSLNVTECTTDSPTYRLNLTDMLDKELQLGDFGINLADINWPSEIQDKLDLINDLLLAIFIVYVIGMGFCGLAVLGCIGSLIFASSRAMVLINFILAFLGAIALTVGSIVVTIAGTKGVDEFNDVANDVGVSASRGRNFLIISWVACGCMILAAAFWTFRFCVLCAQRRRDRKVVAHKGDYYEKGGYSRKSNWGNSKSGRKWGRAFGGVGHDVGDGVGHGAGDGSS